MNTKSILAALCAAGVSAFAFADETAKAPAAADGQQVAEANEEETSFVSVEVAVAYDSNHVSYGLPDTKAPIITPSGAITFFDLLTLDCGFVMDTTHYSRKLGIGNRRWQYWELDADAGLAYTFSDEDFKFLPTSVELGVGYTYEYHPRYAKCKTDGVNGNPDTQFVTAYVALPDLWVVPTLSYERDIVRDNGTYVNLELAHEFALIDGATEDDDPVLALNVAVAQGFGNNARVKSYLNKADYSYNAADDVWEADPLDHAGLMDSTITFDLTWNITDWLAVNGYVQYCEFLFDRDIRDASRYYEPMGSSDARLSSSDSYHFYWGMALTASF